MNQGAILGSQKGKWITLAVFVAVLAALLTASVVRAQQDSTISYAEGGTDPVASFEATDPEGMPIHWELLGNADNVDDVEGADIADREHFTLVEGVLSFSIGDDGDPPDFEAPRGAAPTDPLNNTYKVVAVAMDLATGGMSGYRKVIVNVTTWTRTGR